MTRRISSILVLSVFAFQAGCARQQEEQATDLTVPVTVQPVGLGTVESVVSTTGTLRPVREAQLAAEVQGYLHLASLNGGGKPREGSRVKEGELVARLENEELVVGARLEPRRLARLTAEKAMKEQEMLFKRGLVTEKDVESARQALADAESNYQNALVQLGKMKVRAPISGFVTGLATVTEGTLVEARTVICNIMDYTQVVADLKVPNAWIASVHVVQEVRVSNYALPDRVFTGSITAVDPVLDAATRTFRVTATVDNLDLLLRPGMFVKADIILESRRDVVVVPRQFLLTRQNRKVVFVEEGGRAQMQTVETGLEDRTQVEILSGLDPGDRLITSNYETLRSRTRVRVTGGQP